MKPDKSSTFMFFVVVAMLASAAPTWAQTFLGPTAYLSQADSPFNADITAGTTHLETFEDGLLNTPGVSASAGGGVIGPGGLTDSVDADDGTIDGSGTGGRSFFSASGAAGITFTFNAAVLGSLPTQAGIVWTDGLGTATFEAFDASSASLGTIGPVAIGDGSVSGTTAEDRFFGVIHAAGISAIKISNTGGGIEVDHLQYDPRVAPLDHFLCYKAKTTPGTEKFQPRDVSLKDQFDTEPGTVNVKKPVSLCNPADKNEEGINDPDTHLKGYKIKPETAHVPQTNILVKNQFHPDGLSVDTIKPDRLLVPTLKDLDNPVTLPDPFEPNVDHFKCYKVKVTPGTAKFPKGIQASVKDQFNEVAKLYDIKKPRRLCNPGDKNEEGIKNDAAHLLCYQAKPASGQPKHLPVTGIHVNNQFGAEQLDTIKEEELCVPSEKIIE